MLSEGSVVKLVSQGLETDTPGFESSHGPTSATVQDKLFNVSKPQLSYLKNRDNKSTNFLELVICDTCKVLTWSEQSINTGY